MIRSPAEGLARLGLRLALLTLPAALRQGIEADLMESMVPPSGPRVPPTPSARQLWAISHAVLGIAWHYQCECHRSHESRLHLSVLLAVCAALMFLVPPALRTAALGWSSVRDGDPVSEMLLGVMISMGAAAAAGVVLGRWAPTAPHLAGMRNLIVGWLAVIALAHPGWRDALAGLVALALGFWLGAGRRRAGLVDPG